MAENGEMKARQKDNDDTLVQSVELGVMLREMREKAGYTVSSLAASTRITEEFILALEKGDLAKTPGDIFCRGFIKIISKSCGQDPQKYLALYLDIIKPNKEADDKLGAQKMHRLNSGLNRVKGMDLSGARDKVFSFLKYLLPSSIFSKISLRGWAFITGTILVLGLSVYGLFRLSQSTENETFSAKVSQPSQEEASVDEEDAEQLVQVPAPEEEVIVATDTATDLPNKIEEPAVEEPTKPSVDETIGAGSEVLDLRIKKEVKIRIKVDKESWVTKTLPADTSIQYKFNDKVQLLVFDASALDLNFNGKSLGDLGEPGRIRRLSFVGKDYAATIEKSDSDKEKM